ncbi:MAG: recombination regulator RecX [Eubacterium sp.]|nr:recombination regulator RecX [Eubacterium sp.]MDE6156407.1 recombination regulator RecX [Eubacterium sp.]MDE6767721.1 recombination regulator RecX [Eubacterium sp.]
MIIKHQRGRGNKVHLLLDDEYVITTDINFWLDNYIADGTDIDEEQWQELVEGINYKKALNKCADLLSRREHSVKELKTKLLRTVDEFSAQKAIDRYLEAGYLDDEHFCESLVDYLCNVKKYSTNHVRQECYKRGVDSDIIRRVLDSFEVDNTDTIVELIEKKYSSKLEKENGKEKVIAALQRKGFSYSDIKLAFYRLEENEF